jgi:hypothetical protein
MIPTVIGATMANMGQGGGCNNMVPFEKLPAERQEALATYYGGKIETLWTRVASDPRAAAKLVFGGKNGGLKSADGALRPANGALFEGVAPVSGPFTLVKLSVAGSGTGARGTWKSTASDGAEVFQTVDFKINDWKLGDAMMIHRIAITDAAQAPPVPDTMCVLGKDAQPLW